MRTQERGFTLIETLVALAIAIVTGVLFFQGFVTGTRVAHIADQQQAALLVARSRLIAIGFENPITVGEQKGVTKQGIVWRISIKPYLLENTVGRDDHPTAFWATVRVSWRDNRARKQRSFHLTTLKLGHIE